MVFNCFSHPNRFDSGLVNRTACCSHPADELVRCLLLRSEEHDATPTQADGTGRADGVAIKPVKTSQSDAPLLPSLTRPHIARVVPTDTDPIDSSTDISNLSGNKDLSSSIEGAVGVLLDGVLSAYDDASYRRSVVAVISADVDDGAGDLDDADAP